MIKCPICGKYEFKKVDDYDICPTCKWENDELQRKDPNYSGGANDLSLNEYKREFEKNN